MQKPRPVMRLRRNDRGAPTRSSREPVSTPDQVRGRLSLENALEREYRHGYPSRRLAADTPRTKGVFHRYGLAGSDHRGRSAGADRLDPRGVRAGRAHGLALAPFGPDAVRHLGNRPGSDQGRTGARDPAWRCGLDSARRETLAWRIAYQRHGPYRDAGIAGRKLCDLDGAGDRRGIFRSGRRIAAGQWQPFG